MSTKPKPPCQSLRTWLRGNLGDRCLAPLTSTDAKALDAAVHILELYAYDRNPRVLGAFKEVVLRMQPSTRYLAYHAIAMVMNWEDRSTIWLNADLPVFWLGLGRVEPECKFAS